MKLIPFILKKSSVPKLKVYKITVFLAHGGQSVWEVDDDSSLDQHLESNGLFLEKTFQKGDYIYCKINTEKTRLSDFYMWEEIQEDSTKKLFECWRSYYYFFDSSNAEWWSAKDLHLAEINGFGSVSKLFEEISVV